MGGATGIIELRINDPLGVYVAGLADRTSAGSSLTMDRPRLKGQTSFATLSAPAAWELPNIIGLPMAAQHAIHIKNSEPQIFELNGRTVRTPQIDLEPLGSGGQGILRRSQLNLNPSVSFLTGPLYIQNLDFTTLTLHENPLSPSVVENGGLFIDVDMQDGADSLQDKSFLFDTGASLTVVSEQTAVRLGFDPILDEPDFEIAVEGSGGVSTGIPGFYVDELRLDTVGGSFTASNVPIAVLDVTNPSDPGNVVDGILGMNVFTGRDLVIDANPSVGQGGVGPSLYISDPVTTARAWGTTAASGDWVVANSWSAAGVPTQMWDATVANIRGSNQEAILSTNSTVFRTTISGAPAAEMSVRVTSTGKLTVFADLQIEVGGRLHLDGGEVDAQFIQNDGGRLTGNGHIFVGVGPLEGAVRNFGGTIAPGDEDGNPIGKIEIVGDLANVDGTFVFDLGGRTPGTTYDQISVERLAFLSGTLDVSLVDLGGGLFQPQIGDTFTLLSALGGVQGTFDVLDLPNGFDWNVNYTSTSVRLQVAGVGFVGDFDSDGDLDCDDINLLSSIAASGGGSGIFDLTGDGVVDDLDVADWILNQKETVMGDANLDGVVDSSDFNVWNGSKFTATSAWCRGDFTSDGFVDASDFNVWNRNKFTSAASAVPEPAAWCLALASLLAMVRRRSG